MNAGKKKLIVSGGIVPGLGAWRSGVCNKSVADNCIQCPSGLDIGYVPAGPHAFLRLSGQFGPLQLIPVASGFFFFFFLVLRMPPLFLLGIGKTRKATLIRTYFFVIYRPNVKKCATSRVKS